MALDNPIRVHKGMLYSGLVRPECTESGMLQYAPYCPLHIGIGSLLHSDIANRLQCLFEGAMLWPASVKTMMFHTNFIALVLFILSC